MKFVLPEAQVFYRVAPIMWPWTMDKLVKFFAREMSVMVRSDTDYLWTIHADARETTQEVYAYYNTARRTVIARGNQYVKDAMPGRTN